MGRAPPSLSGATSSALALTRTLTTSGVADATSRAASGGGCAAPAELRLDRHESKPDRP